eukprot:CAMPEP_0175531012 /NCGR_PEP_ID=MMETSP0096-20121207/21951_1 /TAXON_ID=311494 /ORGANISM="Alexandrium monilatum, Strain CCMP3105" /LENGTH=187 /DNA_ID=CAMNT_0016833739 /DNA_START=42 /DNA_END=601 /DNA_ORIENTATION=-
MRLLSSRLRQPAQLLASEAPVLIPVRKVHGQPFRLFSVPLQRRQLRALQPAGAQVRGADALGPRGLRSRRLCLRFVSQTQTPIDGVLDDLRAVLQVVPPPEVDHVHQVPCPRVAGELTPLVPEDLLQRAVLPANPLDGIQLADGVVGAVGAHRDRRLQQVPGIPRDEAIEPDSRSAEGHLLSGPGGR